MKSVEKIERKIPVITRRKRVAAYARVSVLTNRMEHSLSSQVSYYSTLIQDHPEWEYVGVYTDSFISGTGTAKRAEFLRMIQDCERGKIDIILTKSISRFARNTIDLLQTVRHLKDLGIEVRFERENIRSLSADGELMLSILASYAQDESRSISENIKWGFRKKYRRGIPHARCKIYGYRWEGEQLVIVPEEAEIVRLIFDAYLGGLSLADVSREVEKKVADGTTFSVSHIWSILGNIHYTGNFLFQKRYVLDPISKKTCRNDGVLPQYWVENSHEAIISLETFQKVQAERERRKEIGAWHPGTNCFTSKLVCANCGSRYRMHTRRWKNSRLHFWACLAKERRGVRFCSAKNIWEKPLIKMCCDVLGISEFDEEVFSSRVDQIKVTADGTLIFQMKDGKEAIKKWTKR